MKFNVAELKKSVADLKEENRKRLTEKHEAKLKELEEQAAQWCDQNLKHWFALAETIKDRVHSNKPITFDDIPPELHRRASYHSGLSGLYSPESLVDLDKQILRANDQLDALEVFLNAVADEEITSTSLRDFGFRNFRELLTNA